MKDFVKKFKYYIMGLGIIVLFIMTVILKNNKIIDLLGKLRERQVESEEERINNKIDEAVKQGKIKKEEIKDMTNQQRADWYTNRYGKK